MYQSPDSVNYKSLCTRVFLSGGAGLVGAYSLLPDIKKAICAGLIAAFAAAESFLKIPTPPK